MPKTMDLSFVAVETHVLLYSYLSHQADPRMECVSARGKELTASARRKCNCPDKESKSSNCVSARDLHFFWFDPLPIVAQRCADDVRNSHRFLPLNKPWPQLSPNPLMISRIERTCQAKTSPG